MTPNSDLGGFIDKCQWHYGLGRGKASGPVPWCACGAGFAHHLTGADDGGLISPSTGITCQRADVAGGLKPVGRIPVGTLVLWCGIHMGITVRDREDGIIDTVECNAGDGIRRLVRDVDDCRLILTPAAKAVDDFDKPSFVMVDRYGFDDLETKPLTFGLWRSAQGRNQKRDGWQTNHPDWWVANVKAVRDGVPWYGFRAGKLGTYGDKWRRGGWRTKEIREQKIEEFKNAEGHANVRRWRIKVPVPYKADTSEGQPTGVGGIGTT